MTDSENDISRYARKYIFDYFFANCCAPVLEEIIQRFSLNRDEGDALLRGLEASHHLLLLPGTRRILMANPFSGITAPFRDIIGGRTYFANCAWDTISLHVMVGQDTEVAFFCHHCAEPIRIRLSQGKRVASEPENPLIFLSVPVAKWCENLIDTCSNNMVYFHSEEHQGRWLESHPGIG